MKTVILELTYHDEVSADTVEALLDGHANDEGLVFIVGRVTGGQISRIVTQDDGEE